MDTALPPVVQEMLDGLVVAAREQLREDLRSVVLFGSAAEGRMRATSDLNLLFVLWRFRRERIDTFREPLRLASVTVRANAMFVLEVELPAVAESFAVKFDDIERRHRILFGDDVLAGLVIPRAAKVARLRQVILNLTLRLRERYALVSLREEQLALVIADAAGPLRSIAATLLELEGAPVPTPKEALERIAATLEGEGWPAVLELISRARESRSLPPGSAAPELFRLLELLDGLSGRLERLA